MPRDHRTRGDRPPGEPRQDAAEHNEKIANDEALDTQDALRARQDVRQRCPTSDR